MSRPRRIVLALLGIAAMLVAAAIPMSALWDLGRADWVAEEQPPPDPPAENRTLRHDLRFGRITKTVILRDGGVLAGWGCILLAIGGASACVIAAAARRAEGE